MVRVTVHLKSGLGNRLFQLAAAATFAAKHHCELVVYDGLVEEPVHDKQANEFLWTVVKVPHMEGLPEQSVTVYGTYEALDLYEITSSSVIVLEGFFQDARFASALRPYVQDYLDSVTSSVPRRTNSVMVHVRLGDYNHQAPGNLHYIDIAKFYKRALAYVETSKLLEVFSDEPDKIETILGPSLEGRTYVVAPRGSLHMTLESMITCTGAVIANSTFSWWAAMFMTWTHPSAFVMMPSPWSRLETIWSTLSRATKYVEPAGLLVPGKDFGPDFDRWKALEFGGPTLVRSEWFIAAIVAILVCFVLWWFLGKKTVSLAMNAGLSAGVGLAKKAILGV